MEYKEFCGKDVDEAITNASVSFGVTSDHIDYEVINKGSNGIFGIASRDAVIKARILSDEELNADNAEENEISDDIQEEVVVSEEVSKETSAELSSDEISNAEDICTEFINGVCKEMNIDVQEVYFYDEINKTLNVELRGDDMGVIIGKRGQTLDSLQYLTNLAVNRKLESFIHIRIDTENYRERRKKTLENLAHNVAYKVKKTGKPVALESMNSYERRIIHAALSDDSRISTHSEGEDPYRHVVVTLK